MTLLRLVTSLTCMVYFCGSLLLLEATNSPHIQPFKTQVAKEIVKISHLQPQSGMQSIDCMYVINLKEREEKWKRMQTICAEHTLFPSRVNAVKGTSLTTKTLKKLFGPYPYRRLKRGQVGCLLSHISIFADASARQFNRVWICEDDIEFIEDPHQLPELLDNLSQLDPDWDILYTDIESIVPNCYKEFNCEPGTELPNRSHDFRPNQYHYPLSYYLSKCVLNEDFTRIGQRYGSYSYFVSKKGIQKLVNYFLYIYLWTPIDVDVHYVPHIREYRLNKKVVSHWIDSNTHDSQQP